MVITKVKCWHVADAIYDIEQIESQNPTLELIKKSILKTGYRAFCLSDRKDIEASDWYTSYLMNDKVFFYVEGSGVYRLVNLDLVENEFYFEKSSLPVGYKPWIFYSWQSDHNPPRGHIKDGISDAVSEINSRSPKAEVEIIESTRPEDGAGNIVNSIKDNIDRSLMAIFDATNVVSLDSKDPNSKSYPNANVAFELGYALSRKNDDQVIIVKKSRHKDFASDDAPFDFSQNRRINYEKPAQAKAAIKTAVIEYFERIGFID